MNTRTSTDTRITNDQKRKKELLAESLIKGEARSRKAPLFIKRGPFGKRLTQKDIERGRFLGLYGVGALY